MVVKSARKIIEAHLDIINDYHTIQREKIIFLGNFAFGITHNLRNPLTGIQGKAELLAFKNPALTQDMQSIVGECEKINETLDLVVHKLKQELSTDPQHINFNELLKNELAFLRLDSYFRHSIEKQYEFAESVPLISGVYSDFSQSFNNIIQNALNAMYSAKEKRLSIQTRVNQKHIEILIGDTGCGIEEEDMEKIFLPGYSTKTEQGYRKTDKPIGRGLGLSLAYLLLMKYDADIEVESKDGFGTTFTVQIPYDK